MTDYEFDIAISYKSEIEEKASKIHDFLAEDGWEVFFAPDRQQELLAEKIHQMLYGIYKNKSLMKVLLISESYLEGEWTGLEKRVSLESTKEDRKRLVIVNYTNHVILPGEIGELQYLDGHKLKEDEIAAFITERLKKFVLHDAESPVGEKWEKNRHAAENMVVNNHGIITGDNAHFGNIHL